MHHNSLAHALKVKMKIIHAGYLTFGIESIDGNQAK